MEKQLISNEIAEREFGISTLHEKMANGELRFRLNANDGSSYIRTEASQSDADELVGWQNSHYHKQAIEIYLVQKGLMILATQDAGKSFYECFRAGDSVSTEPFVPHNVYLRPGSIIHTIKHGGDGKPDWHGFPDLDGETKALSEFDAMKKVAETNKAGEIDSRYASYTSIYNSLDGIIWRMPAFLVAGITLIIGITVGIFSKGDAGLPAKIWGAILLLSSVILFLGTYSLHRLRQHHNMMGEELKSLAPDGYFHKREKTIGSFVLPGAPNLFVIVFFSATCFFAISSYLVFSGNQTAYDVLNISNDSPDEVSSE